MTAIKIPPGDSGKLAQFLLKRLLMSGLIDGRAGHTKESYKQHLEEIAEVMASEIQRAQSETKPPRRGVKVTILQEGRPDE